MQRPDEIWMALSAQQLLTNVSTPGVPSPHLGKPLLVLPVAICCRMDLAGALLAAVLAGAASPNALATLGLFALAASNVAERAALSGEVNKNIAVRWMAMVAYAVLRLWRGRIQLVGAAAIGF